MTDNFLAKNNLDRANTCELELIKKGQYRNPYPGEVVFVPPQLQRSNLNVGAALGLFLQSQAIWRRLMEICQGPSRRRRERRREVRICDKTSPLHLSAHVSRVPRVNVATQVNILHQREKNSDTILWMHGDMKWEKWNFIFCVHGTWHEAWCNFLNRHIF